VSEHQTNALEMAKTMTADEIDEATLLMPCSFCGAEPKQHCRSTRNPARPASLHQARSAILWAMWHKGYKAGRERTLADQAA
jgi:hypothetical protein